MASRPRQRLSAAIVLLLAVAAAMGLYLEYRLHRLPAGPMGRPEGDTDLHRGPSGQAPRAEPKQQQRPPPALVLHWPVSLALLHSPLWASALAAQSPPQPLAVHLYLPTNELQLASQFLSEFLLDSAKSDPARPTAARRPFTVQLKPYSALVDGLRRLRPSHVPLPDSLLDPPPVDSNVLQTAEAPTLVYRTLRGAKNVLPATTLQALQKHVDQLRASEAFFAGGPHDVWTPLAPRHYFFHLPLPARQQEEKRQHQQEDGQVKFHPMSWRYLHHGLMDGVLRLSKTSPLESIEDLEQPPKARPPLSAGATIMGLSLTVPTYDFDRLGHLPLDTKFRSRRNELYTLQQPQAYGGVYRLSHMARYLEWYRWRAHGLRLPHDLDVLARLAHLTALASMMMELQATLLYPPPDFGSFLSLPPPLAKAVAAAPLPWGQPSEVKPGPAALASLGKLFQSATLSQLPMHNSAMTYLHRDAGHIYARDTTMVANCTMIMTVHARHESVLDRIKFYHTVLQLHAIYLVWNAQVDPPAQLSARRFRIPVLMARQAQNSMNNRFRRSETLPNTECIVNMDDDWDMPHQIMFFCIRLWHYWFRDRLVGVNHLARLHGRGAPGAAAQRGYESQSQLVAKAGQAAFSSNWLYLKNRTAAMSIVLPSGMVYHRLYMDQYFADQLAPARRTVEKLVNCDDILMNFIAANRTHRPPVFVDVQTERYVRVLPQLDKFTGLWTRSTHLRDRDRCLNEFSQLYGGMRLRYTATAYSIDDHLGNFLVQPVQKDVLDEVQCTLDDVPGGACKDDCVQCTSSRALPPHD